MESLQDYIVPIAVIIIWVLGKLFGGQAEEDGAPPSPRQPTPPNENQAERTRQIQEEIRRKIAERRRESQPPSQPPPVPQRAQRTEPEPAQARRSAQRTTATARQPEPEPQSPAYGWDHPQRDLQQELRIKAQEAEAARLKAEAARMEARARIAKVKPEAVVPMTSANLNLGGTPADFIRSALADPLSTRNAFVFQEVVGTPVALRTEDRIGAS